MSKSKSGGGTTRSRELKQRVRTARGRKSSSTRWLQRQLNDPYVNEAKARGLRSRAAFKLEEIDDRYSLLKPGMAVIDLGNAPGGWSQIAAKRADSIDGDGVVVGLDILEVEPIVGVTQITQDFMADEATEMIKNALGIKADAVLSDMAPNTTGHRQTDHMRIMAYCEAAHWFAREVLKPGGSFLAKTRRGGTESELLALLKKDFETVKHVKPQSSRAESPELFVLATGFRGNDPLETA